MMDEWIICSEIHVLGEQKVFEDYCIVFLRQMKSLYPWTESFLGEIPLGT